MKKLAIFALCCLSSLANASEVEEVKVTARRFEITMIKLSENHRQDPKTGDWHYVEVKEDKKTEA